ncbi:Hypothetical_protein [Hexamita inflata]|uniref:Hypothetical_protein n=1 Tax=Hexamita inflata TaxID=28002 RepID=A0AA86UT11_9EUKA|nr:Hypothetical protein HINF_LOCUS58155 [Hexamita inflata]
MQCIDNNKITTAIYDFVWQSIIILQFSRWSGKITGRVIILILARVQVITGRESSYRSKKQSRPVALMSQLFNQFLPVHAHLLLKAKSLQYINCIKSVFVFCCFTQQVPYGLLPVLQGVKAGFRSNLFKN